MKQPRLLLLALVSLVIPIGCASGPRITDVDTTAALPALPADEPDSSTVRQPENLKAYPVGRYADPSSPDVMHEAHTVYRAETSPQWNLAPSAPTTVPLGPDANATLEAVADPSRQHVALTAELEQRLKQEDQLLQTTYEQNERMSQEIKTLQDQIIKLNQPVKSQQPQISTDAPELPGATDSASQAVAVTNPEPAHERTWTEWARSFWTKSEPTSSANSSPGEKSAGTTFNPKERK